MENQKFKPIYVWAQSLDNQSSDDFFKILDSKANRLNSDTDIIEIRSVVQLMGDINENPPYEFSRLLKWHDSGLNKVVFSSDKNKVLINYSTQDKDNLDRNSSIEVLLDIQNINLNNIVDYIQYFYSGLEDFCQQTKRNAIAIQDNERVTRLNEILNDVHNWNNQIIQINQTNQTNQTENSEETNNSNPNSRFNLPKIILLCLVGAVIYIFKKLFGK